MMGHSIHRSQNGPWVEFSWPTDSLSISCPCYSAIGITDADADIDVELRPRALAQARARNSSDEFLQSRAHPMNLNAMRFLLTSDSSKGQLSERTLEIKILVRLFRPISMKSSDSVTIQVSHAAYRRDSSGRGCWTLRFR
jgi:hypothetical protein